MAERRYGPGGRTLDEVVDGAVRGEDPNKPVPKPPAAPRPESSKPIWERVGLTREQYESAVRQRAEWEAKKARQAEALDRARKGQSNPGN